MAAPDGPVPFLSELQRQITGAIPTELERWLVRPRDDVAYHAGSMVPFLGVTVHQRDSGLLVATDDPSPYPIDLTSTYLSASEVFGRPLRQRELDALLEDADAPALVHACASLLRAEDLHDDGDELDAMLADATLRGQPRERARNLLRDPRRRLLAPQVLLLVAARILTAMPWPQGTVAPAANLDLGRVVWLCLHAGDLVGIGDRGETLFGNVKAGLALEVVANQLFNATTHLLSDIARHERVWHGLAPQVAAARGLPDLQAAFEAATGVPIDTFEAVGFGLYAKQRENGPLIPRSWFSSTSIPPAQLAAVMAQISIEPDTLQTHLHDQIGDELVDRRWRLESFSRWPVLEFDERSWIVLSPQLLVDRFFGGLAPFDAEGGVDDQKAKGQLRQVWQLATEQYGHEVLRSIAGDRVYPEEALQAAYAAPGQRIADAAIDYGDRWVVVDFSARRPPQDLARAVDVTALEKEVETLLVGKAEQLDATIKAIVRDEDALTGSPAVTARRFTPVIVVHSKWPTNPITHELAALRLRERALLQDDRVDPLEILTIEELELVEAVQEAGGPSLAELLENKRRGTLHGVGMAEHILLVERISCLPAKRLRALYEQLMGRTMRTLGYADDGPG